MGDITVCPYCGTGCQMILETGESSQRVVGYSRSPVNSGKLCIKGYSGLTYNFSSERLKYPLMKENGEFRQISWEQALEISVSKLGDISRKYGPDSIAFQSSAKCTNEENYLMQKLARMVGTNNIDHCARSCHSPTAIGLINTIGAGAATGSIASLEDTETFFVIGTNTTEQHPIIGAKIIKEVKKGKNLVVADPRRIQLAGLASVFLQFRPGSDVALLNSIMNVIVENGWEDADFINSRTEGFSSLKKTVSKYSPKVMEGITGIEPEKVYRAAEMIGNAKPTAILYAMGITQHIHGTENVMNVSNLALLTGNVGKRGSGIFPLRGQNNVQGSSDMGALSEFYPGYVRYDSGKLNNFSRIWGKEAPTQKGLSLSEMFEAAAEGKVKAIYIMGENPLITEASTQTVERGIDNLEFLLVQDIFMTMTAGHADIVLPAASSLEKEGTFTNTERRIQLIKRIYSPPGEARPDWWIIKEIGRRLVGMDDYSSPEDIFSEIGRAIYNYSGATYSNIYPIGKQWPINTDNPDGTEILHSKSFPIGRGKFIPVEYGPPAEQTDDEYDFIMTTGRNYFHFHSGTMSRRTDILERESPEPYAEINTNDSRRLNIKERQIITVESRHGSIKIRAKVTSKIPEGIVFIPFHFSEARVNELVGENYDPISKIPEFKVVAVKVIP